MCLTSAELAGRRATRRLQRRLPEMAAHRFARTRQRPGRGRDGFAGADAFVPADGPRHLQDGAFPSLLPRSVAALAGHSDTVQGIRRRNHHYRQTTEKAKVI